MQAKPVETPPRRGRGGRPPAKDAGDVDRRILDAAESLFLRLGFDATSCEQVVVQAGAGKASLYARYANKEALFAAVVRDNVERSLAPAADVLTDAPIDSRLRAVGQSILTHALKPDVVALMRVVLATAHRMPELARLADQIGRDEAVHRVAATIAGKAADRKEALDRALPVANKFIDLIFVPTQMRALLGDDPAELARAGARRVDEAVELLAKAGWLSN
ncbi:TetR/AcrR family transcriptional regulator [Sphingomonas sp. PAMC 26621]|uniref:TetR/AcrR family transcriptional regulator n=1 Tax=Sphingomonas sp. PAMC 26621 TaxID=1112213 RepID=UPI0002882D3B|nr:TetR/AcrR family transcriptional regulator [Sphingomonas sp. PAMC 26621]